MRDTHTKHIANGGPDDRPEIIRDTYLCAFVVAPDGQRLAVLNADDWAGLIEWLEDVEDERIIEAAKERLRASPEASGAIPLEDALDEL